MGKDRDLARNEKPKGRVTFADANVCKHHLVDFCPNTLFTNTKSDLGPCNKLHDDILRAEYQRDPNKERYGYERDFVKRLEQLIQDLDRRIQRGLERLSHQDEVPNIPLPQEVQERVDALTERILTLVNEMESLANEGKIEESSAMSKAIEQLKEQKDSLIRAQAGEVFSIKQQEKRMKVCEICGAFLVIGDTENRVRSHLEGKQHVGYLRIREALKKFSDKLQNQPPPPPLPPPPIPGEPKDDGRAERGLKRTRDEEPDHRARRTSRERSSDRDRERARDRSRERERSRDRDRHRREHRRSSRDRERRRHRSRSRDRSRERSRSRDEKRRRR